MADSEGAGVSANERALYVRSSARLSLYVLSDDRISDSTEHLACLHHGLNPFNIICPTGEPLGQRTILPRSDSIKLCMKFLLKNLKLGFAFSVRQDLGKRPLNFLLWRYRPKHSFPDTFAAHDVLFLEGRSSCILKQHRPLFSQLLGDLGRHARL